MTLRDIHRLADLGTELPFSLDEFAEYDGHLVVDNKIALPLECVSNTFRAVDTDDLFDVEVKDEDGISLGYLCLVTVLGYINLPGLTENQYTAYLAEVEIAEFDQPFHFQRDYLVLDVRHYDRYNEQLRTPSGLWGGFIHSGARLLRPSARLPTEIVARVGLAFPTPLHEESCNRSAMEPFAFERFLKLYHLLELLFDWDVVRDIRALGDDLQGIGRILSKYEAKELVRLRDTITNRCTDIDALAAAANRVREDEDYKRLAAVIFQDYGKENNPYAEPAQFEGLMRDGFTLPRDNRPAYNKRVIGTVAYWIYRTRSSIAHQRIGEYVMTLDDENFIIGFAEPLLREVLRQAFRVVA